VCPPHAAHLRAVGRRRLRAGPLGHAAKARAFFVRALLFARHARLFKRNFKTSTPEE